MKLSKTGGLAFLLLGASAMTAVAYTPETNTFTPGTYDSPGSAILISMTDHQGGIDILIQDSDDLTLSDFRGADQDLFGDKGAWALEAMFGGGGTIHGPGEMIFDGEAATDLMAFINDMMTNQGAESATGQIYIEANAAMQTDGTYGAQFWIQEANARLGDHGTFEAPAGLLDAANYASLIDAITGPASDATLFDVNLAQDFQLPADAATTIPSWNVADATTSGNIADPQGLLGAFGQDGALAA